jgi:hypothetical protein
MFNQNTKLHTHKARTASSIFVIACLIITALSFAACTREEAVEEAPPATEPQTAFTVQLQVGVVQSDG